MFLPVEQLDGMSVHFKNTDFGLEILFVKKKTVGNTTTEKPLQFWLREDEAGWFHVTTYSTYTEIFSNQTAAFEFIYQKLKQEGLVS